MKIDRRITSTKEALRTSLLKIMREQPISSIPVKAICKRANISRGTFYLHYRSPYDLLEEIEREFFADLKQVVEQELGPEPDMVRFLRDILKVLLDHKDTTIVNFSPYGHLGIQTVITGLIHDRLIGIWRYEFPYVGMDLFEYAYSFCSAGAMGIVQTWVGNGFQESPEDVAILILLLGGSIDYTFEHTKGKWKRSSKSPESTPSPTSQI